MSESLVTVKDYTVQVIGMAREEAIKRLHTAAELTADRIRDLCTVPKMADTLEIVYDESTLTAHIGYTAEHAYWFETGIRPHEIRVKRAKALYSHKKNKFFGRRVMHPGVAARPSLVPGLEMSIPAIERAFKDGRA